MLCITSFPVQQAVSDIYWSGLFTGQADLLVRAITHQSIYSPESAMLAIFMVLANDSEPAINKPLWQNIASSKPVTA